MNNLISKLKAIFNFHSLFMLIVFILIGTILAVIENQFMINGKSYIMFSESMFEILFMCFGMIVFMSFTILNYPKNFQFKKLLLIISSIFSISFFVYFFLISFHIEWMFDFIIIGWIFITSIFFVSSLLFDKVNPKFEMIRAFSVGTFWSLMLLVILNVLNQLII